MAFADFMLQLGDGRLHEGSGFVAHILEHGRVDFGLRGSSIGAGFLLRRWHAACCAQLIGPHRHSG